MHALHPIDYTILIAFFAVSLIVGLIMTRRASKSLDHYFLGGRSLPWYLLGVAGMTNWFDLTGTMLITSFLFMLGPRGLFIEFRGGAVLILAFMLVYAGKWHRRSGCLTGAEWMTFRFGEGNLSLAVRVLTAFNTVLWTVGALGYLIVGTKLFMAMMFPWNPFWSTAGILIIATIYTVAAGFYGVVLTDLIQGVIIVISCIVVSVMALMLVPDAASLGATAQAVTGSSQWLSSTPHWWTQMPKGYEDYNFLLMFAFFYLLRNVLGGMGAGAENRYFGARSDRDCGLQSLLQGVTVAFRWPLMMGFAVLGIYLMQELFPNRDALPAASALVHQYVPDVKAPQWSDTLSAIANRPGAYSAELTQGLQNILGDDWQRKLLSVGYHGTVNAEMILPAVMLECVPIGLKGFLLVAMFAALMSTFTGTVNGSSAMFVKDMYQTLLRPQAKDRELIFVSYAATLGLVGGGFAMAAAADNINDIWGWLVMGLGAGGLAPGLLRLYWWRCNAWGMIGGMAFGGVGAVLQRIYLPNMLQWSKLSLADQEWFTANLPAWVNYLLHAPNEWQQFTVFTILSFAGTIIASYLSPPTDMARLEHFYRTTRPFGLWGPVRKRVEAPLLEYIDNENRNDIIAVPFALLWQITLFLIPMQVIIKAWGTFFATLPLLVVSVLGMYFFWYRCLPADQPPPGVLALAGGSRAADP